MWVMVLPRAVARLNRVGFNRVIRPVAGRIGGFGVVEHVGRKSGRAFRTPVNVFRTAAGYVIALTYGPDADWVRNVLAAGGCVLETRGKRIPLGSPRLYRDEGRSVLPAVPRRIVRLIGVDEFLELRPTASG